MSSERINNSEVLLNCAAKSCADTCDSECAYLSLDQVPFGTIVITGAGKLFQYPPSGSSLEDNIVQEAFKLLEDILTNGVCPRNSCDSLVCIREACEFNYFNNINFVNGDIIICDPDNSCRTEIPSQFSIGDALDVFPNLLGINGNLYIVGTNYRKITGFDKLRFVTGSIVIANNDRLISIPTFPSLLNVSSKIIPENCPSTASSTPATCGRAAIIIANNNALRKVVGFEALRQVKDGIYISQNNCITHICGFIHLYRTNRVVIYGNNHLTKLIGFCYTDSINKGLYIVNNNMDGNNDLTISAFLTLESAGEIVVLGNSYLRSFKLDALRSVCGKFVVRCNPHLEELSAVVVCNIGSLFVEHNKNIKSIKFPNVYSINKVLAINDNCNLICLDTFEELKRIGAALVVADNGQLCELKGFGKLKYIGSKCFTRGGTHVELCGGCGCPAQKDLDWGSVIKKDCEPCTVTDDFDKTFYDNLDAESPYALPDAFYQLLCVDVGSNCANDILDDTHADIDIIDASIIIFRNTRLKAIGGFNNLKHIQATPFIIFNPALHTINAFGQLCFALDVWVRNNKYLKYILGFSNLLSIRDLVVLESACLVNWDSLKSLEYAQYITIMAKTDKAVKLPKHPIPSVFGYIIYWSFDNQC